MGHGSALHSYIRAQSCGIYPAGRRHRQQDSGSGQGCHADGREDSPQDSETDGRRIPCGGALEA